MESVNTVTNVDLSTPPIPFYAWSTISHIYTYQKIFGAHVPSDRDDHTNHPLFTELLYDIRK